MPEITPIVSYPGVLAPRGGSYTVSHGVSAQEPSRSPSVEQFDGNGNPLLPAEIGDVVLSDNQKTITIPGCRVDNIKLGMAGGEERLWTICLKDRRWKWLGFGAIFGSYNQLDPNGKPIPWTIRSPAELATICLNMLGEQGFVLSLPPGLTSQWGANLNQFLTLGQRFPPTGLNPPIEWNGDTPAVALQQVADAFGCRIVYDVINDIFLVVPVGVGAGLPDGGIRQYGPSLKQIAVPDGIRVFGDKTKFQMRLLLEAVGKDWDGSWRLLHDLTYAPFIQGARQVTNVTFSGPMGPAPASNNGAAPGNVDLGPAALITTGEYTLTVNGVTFTYTVGGPVSTFTISTFFFGQISGSVNPLIRGVVTVSVPDDLNDPTLILTGVAEGFSFAVTATVNANAAVVLGTGMAARLVQPAIRGERGFDFETPGDFSGVLSTDHLTYDQAVRLAQDTVFKCFRVKNVDASGKGPINVPGYGTIPNRYQLQLTETLVEQTAPVEPNPNFSRNDAWLNPDDAVNQQLLGVDFLDDFLESTYDGYSRDLPFRVYGSFNDHEGRVTYLNYYNHNTNSTDRVFVDGAKIDPVWQIVTFPIYMYRFAGGGRIAASALTLETGCFLRESASNQFARFNVTQRLRQGTATSFFDSQQHLDVKLGIIGSYRFVPSQSRLQGTGLPQITVVSIMCANDAETGLMPAGVIFSLTVNSIEYTYTTSANDTPVIVATALKSAIPNLANIVVTQPARPTTTLSPPVLSPLTTNFPGASNFFVVVTALSANGETTVSNEQTIGVSSSGLSVVKISWRQIPHATGYRIYAGIITGVYPWLVLQADRWMTSYDWRPQLIPAYTVIANVFLPTQHSVSLPVTRTVSGSTVVVSWTAPAGATSYDVYRPAFSGRVLPPATSFTFQLINWTPAPMGTPPIVNTATVPVTLATLVFTGTQNGVDFDLEGNVTFADNPVSVFPVFGISMTAEITQPSLADQQDYFSRLTNVNILEADPLFRANYYLKGMLLKYQTKIVNTIEYNGIEPISCNGAIAQVTWEVGDGKPIRTTASIN